MFKFAFIPTFLAFILTVSNSIAQISEGGTPLTFKEYRKSANANIPVYKLPHIDNELQIKNAEKMAADCEECKKDYWGIGIDVNIQLKKVANYRKMADGRNLWLYQIESENAFSLQLFFDKFRLPKGSKLFIYNEDKSMVLGAFTNANNNNNEMFAIQPIVGKSITIEYSEPQYVDFEGELIISKIIHDFKGILNGTDTKSGSCNINVACPQGNGWKAEISSVALILYYDASNNLTGQCSGALINNTNEDGTPYFLTANHCANGTGLAFDYWNWIFMFNYEAASCNDTSGPMTQSISGATLLDNGASSDYLLLQLSGTPPSSYKVCYSGWDRSSITSTSAVVGIHHPDRGVKKISLDNSMPSESSWSIDCACYTHWEVEAWDQGTTESASSGSPLYNTDHKIIGQLHYGEASCLNTSGFDRYGKFSRSWDAGKFKVWLDPLNTGTTTLDTYCPMPSSGACDNITSIGGCGSEYSQYYTGGDSGSWFTSTANSCGYTSPGIEKIYSFVAPSTDNYSIRVVDSSGSVVYLWKDNSCSSVGWTCIGDIENPGTYGSLSWKAGSTYYILLDDKDTLIGTHIFYINCPCNTPTSLSASSITRTSVYLDWGAVSGATGYQVRYKPATGSIWTTQTTANNYYSASGLSCETTYNWEVRTDCGDENHSIWVSGNNIKTNDCPCLLPPQPELITGETNPIIDSTYIYEIIPISEADSYNWYITGGNINSNNHISIVIWTNIGSQSLSVESVNSCGASNATILKVNVENSKTDITNTSKNSITIYPNPFKDKIFISLDGTDEILKIEVYNTLGHKVKEVSDFHNKTILNMSEIRDGIYFLVIYTGKGNIIRSILKYNEYRE